MRRRPLARVLLSVGDLLWAGVLLLACGPASPQRPGDAPGDHGPDLPGPPADVTVLDEGLAADVLAADVLAADVLAADVLATDVLAADVLAADALAADTLAADVLPEAGPPVDARPDVPCGVVEVCNGQDDDCDGLTDEGLVNDAPCSSGDGACLSFGHFGCDALGLVSCDAPEVAPQDEVCNGQDDDCDGRSDELLRCQVYASCRDVFQRNLVPQDGLYALQNGAEAPVQVYCDMSTDGGGWTLVAASAVLPLDDVSTPYAPALMNLAPVEPSTGIWGGLSDRAAEFDVRFACRARSGVHNDPFDVDLVFYGTPWYGEWARARTDGESCFSEGDGAGAELEAPPRHDLKGDRLRARAEAPAAGYFEGEDDCDDEADFAIDFDDRGNDGDDADGTDWGESNLEARCGGLPIEDGQWFIFVRERDPRELVGRELPGRVGVIGNRTLHGALVRNAVRSSFIPSGAGLAAGLGGHALLILGRVFGGQVDLGPDEVTALETYARTPGHGIVTELDGVAAFTSGYADGLPRPLSSPPGLGWFGAVITGYGPLQRDTPVVPDEPLDFLFRGVPVPLRDPQGTENFVSVGPPPGGSLGLSRAATFPGSPPNFPQGPQAAILRGHHCGTSVLLANFDWADAMTRSTSAMPFLAINLLSEASLPSPPEVPRLCPEFVPPPRRGLLLRCGDTAFEPSRLVPGGYAVSVRDGCAPDEDTQALVIGSNVDPNDLINLRPYLEGGGNVITSRGLSHPVYDLVFGGLSEPGPLLGICGGEVMPEARFSPQDAFWSNADFRALPSSGCGHSLTGLVELTALGGFDNTSVSLAYRDVGLGRLYLVESDYAEAEAPGPETVSLLRRMVFHHQAALSFSGVRTGLPISEIETGGFRECWRSNYSTVDPMEEIEAACGHDVWLVGCGEVGSPSLSVAAMGLRDELLLDVGEGLEAAHDYNGATWYSSPETSLGFADGPDAVIERAPCDVLSPRDERRLCWPMSGGALTPGFRCGARFVFDDSFSRIIHHRPGRL